MVQRWFRGSAFCLFLLISLVSCGDDEIYLKEFIPYFDVTLAGFDLTDTFKTTGILNYHLAFILEGDRCSPSWGDNIPLEENHMLEEIQILRSAGGDVVVSFGGSRGTDLAMSCNTVKSLQAAYQDVIDRYDINRIDFDVEGENIYDPVSVDRRNKAIAGLQLQNPGLTVSFTLPVLPSGLTGSGIYLLHNAFKNNVHVDFINIMTMNYGPENVNDGSRSMADYAIDATRNTINQLNFMGMYHVNLGVTPMIGQNKFEEEVFFLSDAEILVEYLKRERRVEYISMWSSNRDFGSCRGFRTAEPVCSGIIQNDYDFSFLFSTIAINILQLPSES